MTAKRALAAGLCVALATITYHFTKPSAPPSLSPEQTRSGTLVTSEQPARPSSPPTSAAAVSPTNNARRQDRATSAIAPADPVAEPHFAAFNAWMRRYEGATPSDRPQLLEEGIALAKQRRAAMFSMIQTDPQRAIELAVPRFVRSKLPGQVVSLVEEPISAKGDYSVLAALPLPGMEKEVLPITRTMAVEDKTYRAFTYGARKDHPTKRRMPFHGVTLDDVLAVSDDPIRVIPQEEVAELGLTAVDAVCAVTEEPAESQGEPVVLDIGGGEPIWTCRYDHIDILRQQQLAAAGAAGGNSVDGATMESNYTEGRKRIIVFRVAFPNVTTPALTVLAGNQMITNINTWWRTMSYGRTTAALPGQGSDVVLVTLTQNSSVYDDDAGRLRGDVRAAATASGIDLSKYDFDITCVGSTPAYSFAGLGYVGAPGSWLANGYFGVATAVHELGHNLGAPHANFWDTGGESDIGPGGNDEYGDPYDVMGGGGAYSGHYVNKFKYRIGWLSDSDFRRISTSGLYRVYSQDNIDSTGLQGLRMRRNSSMDYHLEFRQLFTGNNWMMNGAKLMWGGNTTDSWSSQLIDTTPGSSNGKNDAAIVIGRTWSDTNANLHITPIGKGHTYPESLDVQVNFGPFPGNVPPVARVTASATTVPVGGSVFFTASATDANGDALAYYWEFDDGGYTVDNSPAQAHSFSAAGDYAVRCVVSDMKGGRSSDYVVVRVGSPSTFTISGRVLDDNQPVEGVQIKAGSRTAYTRSDGSYIVTRVPSGNHALTANLYPYTFINPWSPASITVGPSAANIDFVNLPGGLPAATLVATGAVWKYLDNGSDQGTAWRSSSFDDTTWASGPAQLGYGDDDEATVVSYGADSNNKHITTYFRRGFNVTNLASLTNLVLRLQRDDGGVVYLNGVEVYRNNMPTTTIGYRTVATTTADGEWVQTAINSSMLTSGSNVFAVEIHQVTANSSDISFDLGLSGTLTTSTQKYSAVYVAAPSDGARLTTPTNVMVTANAKINGGSFTLLEFYANGVKFGQSASAPYSAAWLNPQAGTYALTVRATLASGGFQTSAPVSVTVSAPVPAPTSITLVPQGSVWKYRDSGTDQGTAWSAPTFNDTLWPSGPAQLGYGEGDEGTVVCCSAVTPKYITSYYRRSFNVSDPSIITNLTVSLLRDDGGIVYLNGVEVFRSNMPQGDVNYLTLAIDAADDDGTLFHSAFINPALLVPGNNVVAVEVHQNANNSSDLSFDLRLTALTSGTRPPGVYIVSPEPGQTMAAPVSPVITAVAVSPGGQTVTNVALYAGATKLGDDASAPYIFSWANAPVGTFNLIAVSSGNTGLTQTSAPVSITISAPPVGTELVSRGSLWRYLDDGSDQGAAWRARTFDDRDWRLGYGRLGYGDNNEATRVSFGSNPAKRHITTYFRQAFDVSSINASQIRLLLTRDDGVVVYLNGVEVHRDNMPASAVSYNSLATSAVSGADETTWFTKDISVSTLLPGTNVIAVELHQSSIDSSDLGFDLQLVAVRDTNVASGIYLISPAHGAVVTLPSPVALSAFVSSAESVDHVDYYAGGNLIGTRTAVPYALNWVGAPIGTHSITARAVLTGGEIMISPAVDVTVQGPPIQATAVLETFVAQGSTWKVWSNGVPPTGWSDLAFNDAPWPSAPARFGWGLDGEVTTLPSGRTHYFRRSFLCTNAAVVTDLIFQLQRDDGAVVYLNGVEMFRSNMPQGPITSSTLAVATADSMDEQTFFITRLPASGLIEGVNVVAVEVHQSSVSSSDMGFDLQLHGAGTTAPNVAIGRPANNQLFVAPATIDMEASAWPGGSRSVARVEFYSGSTKLGEATSRPYRFTWTNAPLGNYEITARMVDNFGEARLSAPVQIVVGYPPVSSLLIASNTVWRYLDNGSNQGTNWSQPTYNDAAWKNGVAKLGYGGDGAVTIVSYGPSSSSKYITTYFRRIFVVPDDTVITNLICKLVRDDGAVVWLNGRELYRSNMPGGNIAYNTLAGDTIIDERAFHLTSIATTNVQPGTNILAVEIHQNAADSSDMGFNLELTGEGYSAPATPPALAVFSSAADNCTLTWPTASGWILYTSPSIGPDANWMPASVTVGSSGGQSTAVIPTGGAAGFFRLGRP